MHLSFLAPAPTGQRISGAFNFSVFKALLNSLHCGGKCMIKSLLKGPLPPPPPPHTSGPLFVSWNSLLSVAKFNLHLFQSKLASYSIQLNSKVKYHWQYVRSLENECLGLMWLYFMYAKYFGGKLIFRTSMALPGHRRSNHGTYTRLYPRYLRPCSFIWLLH